MPATVKHSNTPQETEAAGADLAGRLTRGDVVLVSGELGSGKTTFVRGACRALGVEGPVTSPTFTIGQVLGDAPEIAHLDLYRLGSLAGEDPALLEDYLTPERVGFVEWPSAGRAQHRARGGARAARARRGRPAADHGRVSLLGLDTSTSAASACVLRGGRRELRAGAATRAAPGSARARERADAGGGRRDGSCGCRVGRPRRDRGGGGAGHLHRPAHRDRHGPRPGERERPPAAPGLVARRAGGRNRGASAAAADRREKGRAVRRAVRGRASGCGRRSPPRPRSLSSDCGRAASRRWQRETARYDFEGCSRRLASRWHRTTRRPMWCVRCTSAAWPPRRRTSRRRPFCPTI